jgi:hypothetical protein
MYRIVGFRLEFLMGRNHTTKYSSDATVPMSYFQLCNSPLYTGYQFLSCKYPTSQKPQEALNLLATEEHY